MNPKNLLELVLLNFIDELKESQKIKVPTQFVKDYLNSGVNEISDAIFELFSTFSENWDIEYGDTLDCNPLSRRTFIIGKNAILFPPKGLENQFEIEILNIHIPPYTPSIQKEIEEHFSYEESILEHFKENGVPMDVWLRLGRHSEYFGKHLVTKNKNTMLAEFLGYTYNDELGNWEMVIDGDYDRHKVEDFKFETSWDWLMRVIKKMDILTAERGGQLSDKNWDCEFELIQISEILIHCNIKMVYDMVCKFVDTYIDKTK